MTIAVTTPTGNVGSHVVRLLCQAGERPLLLMRHPDRLEGELRELVDVVAGDQRDADYVAEATRGVDAVFWVHPDDWSLPDPDADAERTGEGLAAAMRQNHIPRVVFQSTVGAEARTGMGFLDGLGRIEQRLDAAREETGTALLHLRCGYFMTNLLMDLGGLRDGRITNIGRPPLPLVAPLDIATVASLRLLSHGWSGRQVQAVHGPADLSWSDIAVVLSDATGRRIESHEISADEQRSILRDSGASDVMVEGIVGMTEDKDSFVPEQPRTALTTTPTSLAGWAAATLRPALDGVMRDD